MNALHMTGPLGLAAYFLSENAQACAALVNWFGGIDS